MRLASTTVAVFNGVPQVRRFYECEVAVADGKRQALPPRHGRRLAARRLHGVQVPPALLRGGADRFAAAAHDACFVAFFLGCAVTARRLGLPPR